MAMIDVTVAYARPDVQVELPVRLRSGNTVAWAIKYSKILERFSELTFPDVTVGIFGKRVGLDAVLCEGDRVEIYRPLALSPLEARRRRV